MFIAHGICKYLKAPEGRHVLKRKGGRRGSEEARKRGSGRRRGWVPQPVGRGNPAPTIEDISVIGDSALPFALRLCTFASLR